MAEQGMKVAAGQPIMGVDPATGLAYYPAVNPSTNNLIVESAAGGDAVTIADGANVTFGSKADAKSTATDTTPITAMSVWKQISASIQALASSVSIGSIVPGVGATNLGKAEDSAHTTGDVGVFSLGLANEAQTVLAQDGDYIGMGHDTKGNSFVIGNVASGAADAGAPVKVGGKYNSTIQAFTNGQRVDLQVDQRGGLLVQDGQAIASVSVTSAATLFTIADTSGYGSCSLQVTSAGTSCTISYEGSEDGATWYLVSGYIASTAGNNFTINTSTALGANLFPLSSKMFRARVSTYGSGTVTIQGTLKKDPLTKLAILVFGSSGDGNAVSGFGMASVAEGRTTNKTAVTTGQYVRPIATSIGAAINKPFQVPELDWTYAAAASGISNTTTAVQMVAAAGVGIRNYLTSLQISAGALGAATEVAVRDGAGGTVLWRGFLSTAGGTTNATLASPIKSTANTLLEVVTLTATITGSVYVNAQGYQAP